MRTWKIAGLTNRELNGHADNPRTLYGKLLAKKRLVSIFIDRNRRVSDGIGVWKCPVRFSPKLGDRMLLPHRKLTIARVNGISPSMFEIFCEPPDGYRLPVKRNRLPVKRNSTPRTDDKSIESVPAEFARKLERELKVMTEDRNMWKRKAETTQAISDVRA